MTSFLPTIRISLLSMALLLSLPWLYGFREIDLGRGNQVQTGISTGDCLESTGRTVTETRTVGPFSSLVVPDGAFEIRVACGEPPALALTGDRNLLPQITTRLKGTVLTITSSRNICATDPLLINLSVPELKVITVGGANTLHLVCESPEMELNLNGASELRLRGKVTQLRARLRGSATLGAGDYEAEQVRIETWGASSAAVRAGARLVARSHEASEIRYAGAPEQVEIETFEAGEVLAAPDANDP